MRTEEERITDIIAAVRDIRGDTVGMDFKAFSQSPKTQRSVVYSLLCIGEASGCLSDEFPALRPQVPWRAVIGLRNIIAHEYFRTNFKRVWDVVEGPELDDLIKALTDGQH